MQAEAWEIIKRRFAAPPHGSFTPAAVLTEPSLLLETVTGREYHCHSDCHRHIRGNLILTKGILALLGCTVFANLILGKFIFSVIRASWRTPLWWLMLSHIGTDVLDEWVFGFQGAWRGG